MTNSQSLVIDPSAQARLREWGGAALVSQIVRLFLEHAPARLEQVRKGVQDGAIKEAERGAHSLKSSAANVGAIAVSKIAAEMEGLALEGNASAVAAALPQLEAAFSVASAELAASITNLEGGA